MKKGDKYIFIKASGNDPNLGHSFTKNEEYEIDEIESNGNDDVFSVLDDNNIRCHFLLDKEEAKERNYLIFHESFVATKIYKTQLGSIMYE